MKNALGQIVPALLGATRFRVAPSIGLKTGQLGRARSLPERDMRDKDWGYPGRAPVFILAALTLTGCGLAHPKTVYLTRNCVTREEYEKFAKGEPPKVHDQLTGQGDADTRPLAGSALELRGWGHAMLQTLRICSDEKQAGDLINDKLTSK